MKTITVWDPIWTSSLCLTQNLGGKWNIAILKMLARVFISAVKKDKYKFVEHTWLEMQEEILNTIQVRQMRYGSCV
jgi:hypothetical protein